MPSADDTPIRSVLFLTHGLNQGGVSTHMNALGRGLKRQGMHVGIVASRMDEGKPFGVEYFKSAGFDIFQVDFPGYGFNIKNIRKAIRAIRSLRQIAKKYHADILHVHAPTLCLIAQFSKLPYVTTFNIAVDGPKKIRISRWANKLKSSAMGWLSFAISSELEKNLRDDLRIPAGRIRRVKYTIDDADFSPARPEQRTEARNRFNLPMDVPVVCMVASLEERKNHALLLDAMKILKSRGVRLISVLAGSGWGTHEADLHKAIESRGVGDVVRYLGQQPAIDVYHASDIFVLPSRKEGFPLSTIEAMLCGLVAIRTPSEGARDQIRDGETGYIVPFAPADVLADRLQALATDAKLRTSLGNAALTEARHRFTADKMAEEMQNLYAEAIHSA